MFVVKVALKEASDCKEVLPRVVVWRSATMTSGAQCVMTFGIILMPRWSVDSWDLLQQVCIMFS